MASEWAALWKEALQSHTFASDMLAGLTVAAVALPLNLALAVVTGLPPVAGLLAGAIGGSVAAIFGGSPLQITGSATAVSVMVLSIANSFGPQGVALAALLVGVCQVCFGLLCVGRLGRFVAESVLTGFTTGVGLKLLDSQIPEVLGFDYTVLEIAQMMHRPAWLHEVSWLSVVSGIFVIFLVTSLRDYKRFPAALVGIVSVTFVSVYVSWDVSRVGEIPSRFPSPSLPWIAEEHWLSLLSQIFPLAVLASLESILSAQVLEKEAPGKRPYNPNLELLGQGLANMSMGLMSGMPVTGAVARSSVNVQSGGKTKLAALFHALALALMVLVLHKPIAKIPLAALAGLLCVVGFRLINLSQIVRLWKEDKLEALAFVCTAVGTMSGYLLLGLLVGLLLHAGAQFARRDAEAERRQILHEREQGIRAVITCPGTPGEHMDSCSSVVSPDPWIENIRKPHSIAQTAFVHPHATLIGHVILGESVYVAPGTTLRADEGSPFFVGASSNVQDGVLVHALKNKHVLVNGTKWAVYIGHHVSIGHHAIVHGPSYIGDHTFVGFKAVVHDAIVGAHCFLGIGSVVVGVDVPEGRLVPHGHIIDSPEAVARLPRVETLHAQFNEGVVEVNRGLTEAYREAYGGCIHRDEHLFPPQDPSPNV